MRPKTFCKVSLIGAVLFVLVGMTGCESRPFTKKNGARPVRSAVKPKAKPLEAKARPAEVEAAAVAPTVQPAETEAATPTTNPIEPKVEKNAGKRELDELLDLE